MFNTTNTSKEGAEEASFFSLTRNGLQYPDSPSSDISSPMMTPLPFKMMMPMPQQPIMHLLTPATPPVVVEKDDRKKLREYEFPAAAVAIKVEAPAYQAYQNHPFTQLGQQRQQPQSQQQQLPTPPTAKATPVLSYSSKYANFTNNSNTTITTSTTTPQTVVRVSPRPTHSNKNNNSRKPSTTMALSIIEKEKTAYQYPTHRASMVSPPPPPYISSSCSPSSSDHGAGVRTGLTTTITSQSATSAVIAISPPLQQVPEQQHLAYDPTITTATPASLAASHTGKTKRHSLPVALARSASSSSATSLSSPAIIVAGSGVMMSDMVSTTVTPRVFSPKASRDMKRHSLAVTPSSMSSSTSPSNNSRPLSRPSSKSAAGVGLGHRGISNMPPQAIPIFGSTGSAADMMRTPPMVFNPRSSFSSSSSPATRLMERTGTDTERDLSALIGPEHDHKNILMSLSHTNITTHNNSHNSTSSTLSSPPRMQGLLRIASLQRATAAASAAERNLILSTSRIGGGMGPLERTEFPGFWEDAKQHNMHWTVYTIGLAAVVSLVWVLMLPALMMFVPILPGAVMLLLGVQYSVYRWRQRKYNIQQLKDRRPSPAALSSMRAASAALTHSRSSSVVATAPSSPQFHAFSPNHHHLRGVSIGSGVGAAAGLGQGHAYKSSLSSMHTSVESIITGDSFLEPHQPSSSTSTSSSPPSHLRSQFQHQYYRQPGMGSVTGFSATGSPPRFSEAYGGDINTPSPPAMSSSRPTSSHYQTPSPEYRRSWFSGFRTPINSSDTKNNNSNSGRWGSTIQRRESTSSIASSETVSSSSTESACDSRKGSPTTARAATTPGMAIAESPTSDTGSFSSIPMTSPQQPSRAGGEKKYSSGDLSTIMVMAPPPPAYVSRRCEDTQMSEEDMAKVMMGANKKVLHLLQQGGIEEKVVVVLPEIAPLGDLMSDFALDFGAIRY
ncbi:hypothetical protein KI688_009905 [Linnemannia hyalina]|uniref:Uncharacterized protein n=1 Tax=Linnemannia hyalina TaxID=64524 RepID=A0A9P7XX68_9FUNG|nr:hypothetical protein KI688_009905 [Linnemannia hyalina]